MEIVYILVGLLALVAGYFLFFKKSEPALPSPEKKPSLKPKPGVSKKADQRRDELAEEAEADEAPRERPPEAKPTDGKPVSTPPAKKSEAPAAEPAPIAREITDDRPSRTVNVQSLRKGLAKSREAEGFFGRLKALLVGRKEIDAGITEEIEEVLLASDVGVRTTEAILSRLRDGLERNEFGDEAKVWEALRAEAVRILSVEGQAGAFEIKKKPTVVMLVGVNGAGKTTTIGKLATQLKAQGKTCVLAAGDTFRAAAVQQLKVWGERVGCEVIHGKDGADPGSVVFEAIKRAIEVNADVVLADTAGRLHTKTNLMTQMKKIVKTADKALSGAPHETLLVIDATNGQNAAAQATEFKEALGLTGIVLTKLDGTAKGGMILGICDTLRVPVRFVGLGERPDDLHEFSPEAFVEALLGRDS
ncbi:MAG TPA: signal recognition particle-docking protein FtsY [Polyangiaceae bacterium]